MTLLKNVINYMQSDNLYLQFDKPNCTTSKAKLFGLYRWQKLKHFHTFWLICSTTFTALHNLFLFGMSSGDAMWYARLWNATFSKWKCYSVTLLWFLQMLLICLLSISAVIMSRNLYSRMLRLVGSWIFCPILPHRFLSLPRMLLLLTILTEYFLDFVYLARCPST